MEYTQQLAVQDQRMFDQNGVATCYSHLPIRRCRHQGADKIDDLNTIVLELRKHRG